MKNKFFIQVLKGVVISLTVSIGLILIFAIFVKYTNVNVQTIQGINQAIKIISVIMGVIITVRGDKGIVKGILIGILFVLSSYVVFSLIEGKFDLGFTQLIDLVSGIISGAISGVLSVNLIKQRDKNS